MKYLQRWFDETTLMILGNVSYGASSFWTAFVEDDISYYLGKLKQVNKTKGLNSWLSCVLCFLVLSLPHIVWYLIVSIPDLCLRLYFFILIFEDN